MDTGKLMQIIKLVEYYIFEQNKFARGIPSAWDPYPNRMAEYMMSNRRRGWGK